MIIILMLVILHIFRHFQLLFRVLSEQVILQEWHWQYILADLPLSSGCCTAAIGMCTKFVEVTISHKYRDILPDGTVSGGPMYYMKKRLNITTKSGKVIKTGAFMGAFFAAATVLSSFGTGSLPQINSISNSVFTTFGIKQIIYRSCTCSYSCLDYYRRN